MFSPLPIPLLLVQGRIAPTAVGEKPAAGGYPTAVGVQPTTPGAQPLSPASLPPHTPFVSSSGTDVPRGSGQGSVSSSAPQNTEARRTKGMAFAIA